MLPSLCELSLELDEGWVDALAPRQELGRLTKLTALEISAATAQASRAPLFTFQDLVAVSGLKKLQRLHVLSSNMAEPPGAPSAQRSRVCRIGLLLKSNCGSSTETSCIIQKGCSMSNPSRAGRCVATAIAEQCAVQF